MFQWRLDILEDADAPNAVATPMMRSTPAEDCPGPWGVPRLLFQTASWGGPRGASSFLSWLAGENINRGVLRGFWDGRLHNNVSRTKIHRLMSIVSVLSPFRTIQTWTWLSRGSDARPLRRVLNLQRIVVVETYLFHFCYEVTYIWWMFVLFFFSFDDSRRDALTCHLSCSKHTYIECKPIGVVCCAQRVCAGLPARNSQCGFTATEPIPSPSSTCINPCGRDTVYIRHDVKIEERTQTFKSNCLICQKGWQNVD